MDSTDDVGVPVRRKQKKHFLEEGDLVRQLLSEEHSSGQGFDDLRREVLGRRGSGLCRSSDTVSLCFGEKARSLSPQTQASPVYSPHGHSRAIPPQVAEYGFTRLGKSPQGRRDRDSSPLAWPEPSEGSPAPSHRACSRRQDSRQARACLELVAPDLGFADVPSSAPSARSRSSQGWIGWRQNEEVADHREQERTLQEEEVQSGMTRRSGRCMRDSSLRHALRHTGVPNLSSCDDLRQDKLLPRRGSRSAAHRSSSRVAAVLSPCRAEDQLPSAARAESLHSRRADVHKASELWAPWLLNYEKELQEQRCRLSSRGEGRAGRPAPAPFPCSGLHMAGGSVHDTGVRRGRSPDAPAWDAAGKAAQEPSKPLCFTCPFWRGDSESTATPESTAHAHFNGGRTSPTRSPSPTRSEASAEKSADGIHWFKAPEAMPLRTTRTARSGRSPRTRAAEAMAPLSSPSRFDDQPSRRREQLAQETFLVTPLSGRAGKPTDLGFVGPTWPPVASPRVRSSAFPQSLSPPTVFAPAS